MSNGALDRTTFETIEAYVLDRMGALERAAFEDQLAADPLLRQEVVLQQEHIHAVELDGLMRTLRRQAQLHPASEGGVRWPVILRYAAAVAVMLSAALFWYTRPTTNERLFAEHFRPDPGLPVVMGITSDPVFADAMVSYKEGEHAKARYAWTIMLQHQPGNDTLRYYIASAWLAEGGFSEALPLLEQVATDDASTFHHRARWYLFLTRIRIGDTAKALAMPIDDDPVYGERVRAIEQGLAP